MEFWEDDEPEIWKPIHIEALTGRFLVSNYGRVKSVSRRVWARYGCMRTIKSKMINQSITDKDYRRVTLKGPENKQYNYFVHRLVAALFCDNLDNLPYVNHLDSDPSNNYYKNLKWCTQSENIKYAYEQGRAKSPKSYFGKFGTEHNRSKTVYQFDKNGNFIAEFGSGCEAARILGIKQSGISSVITGKLKTTSGFIFKLSRET